MAKIPHGKIPSDSAEDFKKIYGGGRVISQPRKAVRKPLAKKKTRKSISVKP